MRCHFGDIGHALLFVLIEDDVPQLWKLIIEFLRVVFEELLFSPAQNLMGKVEPDLIVNHPVPMKAGEVETHMFCWGLMFGDEDVMDASCIGSEVSAGLGGVSIKVEEVVHCPVVEGCWCWEHSECLKWPVKTFPGGGVEGEDVSSDPGDGVIEGCLLLVLF